jgi:8-oxo-dGTP diphosphatase
MQRGQHVVAVAALVLRGDKVLAMRRSSTNEAGAGLWETLSGRIEHGEQPLAAMQREIDEECGLEVTIDPRPVEAYAATRTGEPMIVVVYRALYVAGEVRLSAEHDAYAWLSAAEFAARSTLAPLVLAVDKAFVLPQ